MLASHNKYHAMNQQVCLYGITLYSQKLFKIAQTLPACVRHQKVPGAQPHFISNDLT